MPTFERPTNIGKYEILATLGRGGMGVVYKARDPVIDRIVAIKTILVGEEVDEEDNLADRLTMEARSAGRLHHPNIVTVFDFGTEGELSYIVMEYVEGTNLARVIDEKRPLPLDTKLSLLVQIANGLAYAHERGVIHRDMKPSNICIASPGTAKILDFGLARFDSTRLTKTGYMAGTIAYMSPERLGGTTGAQDDIFALGAVAYELLTYQRAFPGATPPEVFGKILSSVGPPPPSQFAELPHELDRVILKALSKEAEHRYTTATEFADDLRHFVSTDVHRTINDAPTVARPLAEFVTKSGSAYGAPTRISEQPTTIVPDVTTKGASTKPDLDLTGTSTASTAPTRIMPLPRRYPRWMWIAPAAVLAIVVAGALMWPRPAPAVKPVQIKPTSPTPTTAKTTVNTIARNPAAEDTEVQLATARGLSDELARRRLNAAESISFSKAKALLTVAERKFNQKDYQGGGRLAADAIAGLQAVISRNDQRLQNMAPNTTAGDSKKKPPVPQPQPPPPTPQPQPQPQPQPPAPTPAPVPQPVPAHESPEREIGAFMQQLAAAYQSRDVEFFREHSLQFNEALANGVRKSPSVRVELQVQSIDVRDPQHANVTVKRTDWFPDPSMPPATQSLVYHLDRSAGRWQIASIGRQ